MTARANNSRHTLATCRPTGPVLALPIVLVAAASCRHAPSASVPSLDAGAVAVSCEAVWTEYGREDAVGRRSPLPDLVVMGRPLADHEVAVERVLFGSWSSATINVEQRLADRDRRVLSLAGSAAPAEPLRLLRSQPIVEAEAATVLAQAGVDCMALSTRPRIGPAGTLEFVDSDGNKLLAVPAALRPTVDEAEQRRNRYPLAGSDEAAPRQVVREVVYLGPIDHALDLLGSESKGASMLAARGLVARPDAARPALVALVSDRAFVSDAERRASRGLHQAIAGLGAIERQHPTGAILRLLQAILSRLERDPSSRPPPDENHGLTWLVDELDPSVVDAQVADRMLALRARLNAGWRDEIDLALESSGVLDERELRTATAKMAGIPPVRSRNGLGAPIERASTLAFSPDGNYLAAGESAQALFIWRTSDFKPAGRVAVGGTLAGIAFSRDGATLYVAGGGPGAAIQAGFDWRTGKRSVAFAGHKEGLHAMALSDDGQRMATASLYDDRVILWDAPTAREVRKWPLAADSLLIALSPDGRLLARQTGARELQIDELPHGSAHKIELPARPAAILFSRDGGELFAAPQDDDRILRVRVGDGSRLASIPDRQHGGDVSLALDPAGRHLAVGADDAVSVVEVSSLRRLALLPLPGEKRDGPTRVAFSPDGRWLGVGSTRPAPVLYRTSDWRRVPAFNEPTGEIRALHAAAGKLRTVGRDGALCRWDAASLSVESCVTPDEPCDVVTTSNDGRYVVCIPRGVTNGPVHARTIESDSGRLIATLELSWTPNTTVRWYGERELVQIENKRIARYDALSGRRLGAVTTTVGPLLLPAGTGRFLAEDGRTLIEIGGGLKIPSLAVRRIDVHTGRLLGERTTPLPRFTGNVRGLVADRKQLYIGAPGLYLYDRATLRATLARPLTRSEIFNVAFSLDGSRFALTMARQTHDASDPRRASLVRVHDTASGQTRFAFAPRSATSRAQFIDDRQLVVINDDGTLELWNLPQ
jgi:WD40 repeat protein